MVWPDSNLMFGEHENALYITRGRNKKKVSIKQCQSRYENKYRKKNRDLSKAWNGSSFWLKDLRLLQGRSSTYVQQIAHESTNLIQFQNKGKKQLHNQNANQAKKITICYTGKMCSRQKVMQATIKMLLGEMLYRRVCNWQMSTQQLSTRHMSTRQIRTR